MAGEAGAEEEARFMTPRPFYRWKSFWLGMVVLVFLCWAWVRSVGYRDAVTFYFPSAGHELALASRAGAFVMAWEELPNSGVIWPVFTRSHRATAGGQWFPPAVEMWNGRWGEVSYWLMILLFLPAWLGFLFWRVRRRREAGS